MGVVGHTNGYVTFYQAGGFISWNINSLFARYLYSLAHPVTMNWSEVEISTPHTQKQKQRNKEQDIMYQFARLAIQPYPPSHSKKLSSWCKSTHLYALDDLDLAHVLLQSNRGRSAPSSKDFKRKKDSSCSPDDPGECSKCSIGTGSHADGTPTE